MSRRWQNWARSASSTPAVTIAPKRIEQIVMAVERALETGHTVKPIGNSHSFTSIGATEGIRIDMHHMRGLIDVDLERQRVTVAAGTHLWEISTMLDELGLALPNMGDIDRQTITGATQTATHGTGLGFGGLATGIVGMTIVTGIGEVLTIDERDPELLSAASVSLGALGVITQVTLQCVPAFSLRAEESADTLERVLADYADISRAADHFEFYWFPHTRQVRTKTNTRIEGTGRLEPLSPISRWIDEELVNNTLLGLVLETERHVPKVIPRINRMISTVSSSRSYVDRSHRVFVTQRRVKFRETEFAVPFEVVPDVVRAIGDVIERRKFTISFPIEVRNARADSLMMSTATGRETGYIAVHRYIKDDEREYFREVQAIMKDVGGRPHWGKMHTLDAAYLSEQYPQFQDFLAVRDRLDPDRVFTNPYLSRVLGA